MFWSVWIMLYAIMFSAGVTNDSPRKLVNSQVEVQVVHVNWAVSEFQD